MKFTSKEIQNKVEKTASKILIFDSIRYTETKRFDSGSCYIIFALFNKTFGCYNSATYDVNNNTIEFATHRVSCL